MVLWCLMPLSTIFQLFRLSAEEGRVVRPKAPDKFSEILFIYLDMRDFNYIYIILKFNINYGI
jgi:hypothetical protein